MRFCVERIVGVRAIVALISLALPVVSPAYAQPATQAAAQAAKTLPEKLTSAEFWQLLSDISEPGGYFQIEDNFTSNEAEIAALFTMVRDRNRPASVYMGVGPEQNFSYIAALRPKMAFIVDIRRQAVMQHLMFKAMFEMSKDRADFISILFARPRPSGVDTTTAIDKIWDAFWYVPSDTALQAKNNKLVIDRLTRTHGFAFTADEMRQLQAVMSAFHYFGPEIATRGARQQGRGGGSSGSTFADLTGYYYDAAGKVQSFLSTEDNYRYVKSMHERNLIVPVSGDFAGPKAIRTIGAYIKQNGGTLSAFYVSNVEQYLFQDGKSMAFYNNVATIPVTDASIFIRPYAMRNGAGNPLCPITPFLSAAQAGRVYTHNSALSCPM